MKPILAVLSLIVQMCLAQPTPPGARSVLSDDEIRKILATRVDVQKQTVGIVVGVVEPKGRRVTSYGSFAKGDKRTLDGATAFEIGSISKVFTSLLLADMVERKEVALTDPVAKYLPREGVKMPERGGKQITLIDLSTHTSGLPRLPSNMKPKDPANPYADYTVDQLYQFLSTYALPRDIGSEYEYSNLGGGLLGHVLALRAGTNYEALVRDRIARPLGMRDTAITLSDTMKEHLATGHNAALQPVANWDLPTLAGAGGLRSTANDMLTFLEAFLGYKESALAPAMKAMLEVRRSSNSPTLKTALAWLVASADGQDFILHDGGTGGYTSFIGYNPTARVGVVVLSNTAAPAGVGDIGMHLLNPKMPLQNPAPEHTEIKIDPKIFDRFVGNYQLAPNFSIVITREGDRLYGQATAQPKFEMFAESEKTYFLRVVDAQIAFETNADGKTTGLVLHQMGRDLPGKRID